VVADSDESGGLRKLVKAVYFAFAGLPGLRGWRVGEYGAADSETRSFLAAGPGIL